MVMHCYIKPLTNRLQQVHNRAARLVKFSRKRKHITPVLFHLHWLPVRFRSLYKTPFHTFKVLSETTSLHLSDLIQKYIAVRLLRTESYSLLTVSKSHTTMYWKKSFLSSPLKFRNRLPNCIKFKASKHIFCKVFKTRLFKLGYLYL